MATLLLVVIYIAFIGLGIPDSVFGAAWSAIYPEFGVSSSLAGYVTMIVSGCTVISSVLSARILARFSTHTVSTASTLMTAIALLGYSISPNIYCMCMFASVLGLGAGAIDAALNNYIALYYSAKHMNFLHCFYGVGVIVSPYIMSTMLKNSTWQSGYLSVFFIQITIAFILLISLPLWKKAGQTVGKTSEEIRQTVLTFSQMMKMKSVRLVWILCIATNAIEAIIGIWGSSFLVLKYSMSVSKAAGAIIFYYSGLALGRFVSGLIAEKFNTWKIIFCCFLITGLGILMLFIPIELCIITGFFLIGIGNGPIYPNLMHLTPKNFGESVSASVIGSQMAFAYGGFMAAPALFGLLSDVFSIGVLPLYAFMFFVIMVVITPLFLSSTKTHNS